MLSHPVMHIACWPPNDTGMCTTAAMQVGSRIWILWGIVNLVPGICSLSSVPLGKAGGVAFAFNYTTLLYAWSITEVIRYFFYGIKVCESCDSQLQ